MLVGKAKANRKIDGPSREQKGRRLSRLALDMLARAVSAGRQAVESNTTASWSSKMGREAVWPKTIRCTSSLPRQATGGEAAVS